jgi:polygalacturonase
VSGEVKNITISNCIIRTLCAAVKIGWPEAGNFNISGVTVTNCNIYGTNRGIGINQNNGAVKENITVNNIVFDSNTPTVFVRPIHIDLRKGKDTSRKNGIIRNVNISNFTAYTQGSILITAQKGTAIENLTLSNIKLFYTYIEDPVLYGKNPTSKQASNNNPEARVAKSAIVIENVKNLAVDKVFITWPEANVPEEWKIDTKIENGSVKLHHIDYSKSRQKEFSIWGRGLKNALIDTRFSEASKPGLKKH